VLVKIFKDKWLTFQSWKLSSTYFITSRGAKYCNQHACLSAHDFLSNHLSKFHENVRICYLWPWLSAGINRHDMSLTFYTAIIPFGRGKLHNST